MNASRNKALVLLVMLGAAIPATAQNTPPADPAPAAAPTAAAAPAPTGAVVLGPRFTPLKGQTQERQALDDAQCQNHATQVSGFVLGTPAPGSTVQQGPTGSRARGAAVGAAAGAVTGSAGAGAAAGTVAGGSSNRADRRQANRADQQARAQWEQQQQTWNLQYATCMQQRGYSVP
jgi:hypothetical protein